MPRKSRKDMSNDRRSKNRPESKTREIAEICKDIITIRDKFGNIVRGPQKRYEVINEEELQTR